MFDIKKVCIIGGDLRQVYLGQALTEDGLYVTYAALELCDDAQPDYVGIYTAVTRCDTVILPMPLSKDGKTLYTPLSDIEIPLDENFAAMLRGKRVFCTNSKLLNSTGEYSSTELYDYLKREELAVLNAVPTAEGAIAAAVYNTPVTIHGSRCLVAGFGRIGKFLARDLFALGAKVTVSARRSSDIAWIKACGYSTVKTCDIKDSGEYDIIFNTIPEMIFTESTLKTAAKNALVIDLASKPGGVDLAACERLHIKAEAALSLPGKTAPKTAALIIKDTIYNTAREENP